MRSIVSPIPGYGRATATSACSAPTFARNASKSNAAARSLQSRSARASAIASAAWPVENALLTRSAMASPASSSSSAQSAMGEVGVLREIRLTDGSERAHERHVAGVERAGDRLCDLRADALVPGREPVRQEKQRRSDGVARVPADRDRRGGRRSQIG